MELMKKTTYHVSIKITNNLLTVGSAQVGFEVVRGIVRHKCTLYLLTIEAPISNIRTQRYQSVSYPLFTAECGKHSQCKNETSFPKRRKKNSQSRSTLFLFSLVSPIVESYI